MVSASSSPSPLWLTRNMAAPPREGAAASRTKLTTAPQAESNGPLTLVAKVCPPSRLSGHPCPIDQSGQLRFGGGSDRQHQHQNRVFRGLHPEAVPPQVLRPT